MSIAPAGSEEQRVLLRTVTAKDATLTIGMLAQAGVVAHACMSLTELADEIARGAGAVLIAEEALNDPAIGRVTAALQTQPSWSDLPVLVLARAGVDSSAVVQAMDLSANITVIQRPLRVSSLVSWVRSALRGRRRQYELRGTLDGLREADQRKNEFLATLAHELRNPLAPLHTALTLLKRKPVAAAEAQPYYEMMGRQVDHMVRLIDDLMEVSRITRGKIELQRETLALDSVVEDAIEVSRPLLDAAGHRLSLSIPNGNWNVHGDRVRLTQVFSNILNNSAKYTIAGGRIGVSMERRRDRARIRIRDNGAGIPSDMIDAIFDMFVQVSDTSRAAQGGLGIGLTLVKSLVDLHHGSVAAYSAGLGHGTEVVVELPLLGIDAAVADESPADTSDAALTDTILIVDDNRDAADSLSDLLRSIGASTWVAYGGAQALRLAEQTRPSVAIVDIGMPGMDGCELAERLRSDPRNAALRLIALTGWGQADDRARVTAAGFSHHFLKPLNFDELLAVLQDAG